MWAEEVKRLGKTLNLKPPKNKKSMSKKDIINRILKNKNMYDKALREAKKESTIKTESESSN